MTVTRRCRQTSQGSRVTLTPEMLAKYDDISLDVLIDSVSLRTFVR